jgi:hypothetical protein
VCQTWRAEFFSVVESQQEGGSCFPSQTEQIKKHVFNALSRRFWDMDKYAFMMMADHSILMG